jgi:hypothetical protein
MGTWLLRINVLRSKSPIFDRTSSFEPDARRLSAFVMPRGAFCNGRHALSCWKYLDYFRFQDFSAHNPESACTGAGAALHRRDRAGGRVQKYS